MTRVNRVRGQTTGTNLDRKKYPFKSEPEFLNEKLKYHHQNNENETAHNLGQQNIDNKVFHQIW